jgi:hypothetical protein
MNIRELISESKTVDIPKMFADFLPIAMKVLNINKLPKISLAKSINDAEQPTFGRYINDIVTIQLSIVNRHPVDILRTLAHELVHFRQHSQGQLGTYSGETGSPEENEANEIAGVIMRNFNKAHPIYLSTRPVLYEGWSEKYKQSINCNNPKGFSQRAHCQGRNKEEDYDPNGPPPGPEFKPTMPKGTVKVDVSDVYDWYKLGKNIANLKRAKKQDFGKGPPSTIISFGSEEEEHKYIKDLMKLGLTTTDIDPIDPKQPKSMKRQKTDPTYNVDEAKKRKRKSKKAAYGPGPYGLYGYHSGYSGDSGSGEGGGDGGMGENFADGKNPGRKGLAKRSGVNTKASVSSLRKTAKNSTGEKARMAHWLANMKSGRNK